MQHSHIVPLDVTPQTGDVLFEKATGLRAYLSRISQGSELTETSVVTAVGGGSISTIAMSASGVRERARRVASVDGYVVRPGGRSLGESVGAAVRVIANREPSGSVASDVWRAGRRLRRSPLRWTGVAILIGAAMQAATARRAASYARLSSAEFVLRALTLGSSGSYQTDCCSALALDTCLDGLNTMNGWQASTIELFDALAGRRTP